MLWINFFNQLDELRFQAITEDDMTYYGYIKDGYAYLDYSTGDTVLDAAIVDKAESLCEGWEMLC